MTVDGIGIRAIELTIRVGFRLPDRARFGKFVYESHHAREDLGDGFTLEPREEEHRRAAIEIDPAWPRQPGAMDRRGQGGIIGSNPTTVPTGSAGIFRLFPETASCGNKTADKSTPLALSE